jgi:hypothetical protein
MPIAHEKEEKVVEIMVEKEVVPSNENINMWSKLNCFMYPVEVGREVTRHCKS